MYVKPKIGLFGVRRTIINILITTRALQRSRCLGLSILVSKRGNATYYQLKFIYTNWKLLLYWLYKILIYSFCIKSKQNKTKNKKKNTTEFTVHLFLLKLVCSL